MGLQQLSADSCWMQAGKQTKSSRQAATVMSRQSDASCKKKKKKRKISNLMNYLGQAVDFLWVSAQILWLQVQSVERESIGQGKGSFNVLQKQSLETLAAKDRLTF